MNSQQVQEACEASIRLIHKRTDENAQLEIDLIDVKCQELLAWNKEKAHIQTLWLRSYRAVTLIDKLCVYQYDYNMTMYRLQLEAQKSVSSKNGTDNQ